MMVYYKHLNLCPTWVSTDANWVPHCASQLHVILSDPPLWKTAFGRSPFSNSVGRCVDSTVPSLCAAVGILPVAGEGSLVPVIDDLGSLSGRWRSFLKGLVPPLDFKWADHTGLLTQVFS